MKKEFKEPNININKVYTKLGDDGKTAIIGGQRLGKDNIRIDAYGDVDELNSIIGGVRNSFFPKINKVSGVSFAALSNPED